MSRSHMTLDLPSGPPPEVLTAIDEAWERAQWPLPDDLVLDVESQPLLGRAWGVLRTPDRSVIEQLSATEALAIACGDAVVQHVPALAA